MMDDQVEELRLQIVNCLEKESSLRSTATEIGCSKSTLYNIVSGADIAECRFCLIIALMERYKLSLDFEVNYGK